MSARAARRQRGAALIALMAAITIAALMAIISLVSTALGQGGTNRLKNAETLQLAKTALIGYVAKEALELGNPTPGRLPCPESPNDAGVAGQEGVAASQCAPGNAVLKTIGRLPWRTLGIDKLYDTASEPLWYVVSQNWVYNGAYPVINPGTAGDLTVDGASDVVAMIIAPGAALRVAPNGNQVTDGCTARVQLREDRSHIATSSAAPDFRDYLECQNATSPIDTAFGTTVRDNATNPVLNDHIVYITARDIMTAIQGPVAERMQKTVAPLFYEFSELWPSDTFMPYARAFVTPETTGVTQQSLCGPASPATQTLEGLLPLAAFASSGTCSSGWTNATISTNANASLPSCSVASGAASCTFRYYQLTSFGQGIAALVSAVSPGGTTATVNIQVNDLRGTATFRDPLDPGDVNVNPPAGITTTTTTVPRTDGRVDLTVQLQATSNVCTTGTLPIIGPVVCSSLNVVLAFLGQPVVSAVDVTVTIPPMSNPVLTGTRLSTQVRTAHLPASYDLLTPPTTAPHYWFMQNQWYRYTYYAVAPSASAAAGVDNLRVNGFPTQFGAPNDKRFVLALMGPAVTGQTRSASATLNQYVEGANAVTGGSPRTFAYQVFDQSGNDRIVACPFAVAGTTICN